MESIPWSLSHEGARHVLYMTKRTSLDAGSARSNRLSNGGLIHTFQVAPGIGRSSSKSDLTGAAVSILSLGHRRLRIDIRLERVPGETSADVERRYQNQKTREAALAERANWELHHLSRTGWIR